MALPLPCSMALAPRSTRFRTRRRREAATTVRVCSDKQMVRGSPPCRPRARRTQRRRTSLRSPMLLRVFREREAPRLPRQAWGKQPHRKRSQRLPRMFRHPGPSLYADAGGDRSVIVGADVEFDASAYDKSQNVLDPSSVRFMWNFGDGSSAEGAAVLHHYEYPGRYAVVLEIANNKNAAGDQITITAQPAALSFSQLQDGGVDIQDLAGRDLDLSGWIVREDAGSFASQFLLPSDSKILSGSAIEISLRRRSRSAHPHPRCSNIPTARSRSLWGKVRQLPLLCRLQRDQLLRHKC